MSNPHLLKPKRRTIEVVSALRQEEVATAQGKAGPESRRNYGYLLMDRISRSWPRSIGELPLYAEALLAAVFARALLLSGRFSRARRWAGEECRGDTSECTSVQPERVAAAVKAATALVPGGRNCLVRALAVHRMLNRRGIDNCLRIGASKDAANELAAHAWVDWRGGNVIGGGIGADGYATLQGGPERKPSEAQPCFAQASGEREDVSVKS
jgi:hypothetical protein